jgi:hypothetical protein
MKRALVIGVLLLSPPPALAEPGDLDPTFGDHGLAEGHICHDPLDLITGINAHASKANCPGTSPAVGLGVRVHRPPGS